MRPECRKTFGAFVSMLFLIHCVLTVTVESQIPKPAVASAQEKYDAAVAALKDIGPGAAASFQAYRYTDQPKDFNTDSGSLVIMERLKEFVGGRAPGYAIAQILADMIDINTKGSRPDATEADRDHKTKAEDALKKFIALGDGDLGGAFAAYQKAGFAGDTTKNSARGILSQEIQHAVFTIGGNARNENVGAFLYAAGEFIKSGMHFQPVTPPVFDDSQSAEQRYNAMVKMVRENLGLGAAAALEAVRYARVPIDTFKDESGNVLYEGDKQFVLNAKAQLDVPYDPTVKGATLPIEVSLANIPPLMRIFGTQMGVDLNDVNSNYLAGTKGYDKVRWTNAKETLNGFLKADGDDDASIKDIDESFSEMGTLGDREKELENGLPVVLELMNSANSLVNDLINEEQQSIRDKMADKRKSAQKKE